MSLDLNATMDGIGQLLKMVSGLRVFDFVPDSFSPPAAVVSLPESIDFDFSFREGSHRLTVPVYVLVGKASDRSARDQLSVYMANSGASSIKAAIESDPTLGGTAQTARVSRATVQVMTVAGMDFLAASFDVDVIA